MWKAFCLLAAALLLNGCVLSIEPFIPASLSQFDEKLLGKWTDGDATAIVTRAGGEYEIVYTDQDGKTGTFGARLGKIGEMSVLDVWPDQDWESDTDPDAPLFIPGHLLVSVRMAADSMIIALLKPDVVSTAIDNGTIPLSYQENDGRLLLKAPTQELRSGLGTWIVQDSVWGDRDVMRRIPDNSSSPAP